MTFHPNQIVVVNHPSYTWKLALVVGLFDSGLLKRKMYIVQPIIGPNEITSSWKCFCIPEIYLVPVEIKI